MSGALWRNSVHSTAQYKEVMYTCTCTLFMLEAQSYGVFHRDTLVILCIIVFAANICVTLCHCHYHIQLVLCNFAGLISLTIKHFSLRIYK